MITLYQKTVTDQKLKTLDESRAGTWVHVERPSAEELKRLVRDYALEESLLQDALDPDEVPRLEVEDGIMYIFARIPYRDGKIVRTTPFLIAVASEVVVTLCARKPMFLSRLVDGKVKFSTTQKTRFVLQVLSEISRSYKEFLTSISRETRRMVGKLENISNKAIIEFVVFEEVLNDFLAALVPTNVALQSLLSGRAIKLYEDDQDLVEDVMLANMQLVELSKGTLKSIVNIREAYSTIVANDLNRVIKFLTSLTIILAIPTMIASLFGMNVPLPYADSPLAFGGIIILVVIVTVTLLAVFNKRKWL